MKWETRDSDLEAINRRRHPSEWRSAAKWTIALIVVLIVIFKGPVL